MTCVINKQVVLVRASEGPLAVHLDRFAESASTKGFALSSIHRQVLLATAFSRWLKQERIELHRITSDHPTQYLRFRARQLRPHASDGAALRHLIDFLRIEDLIPAEKISVRQVTEVERCVQDYERHLREARGLATATIVIYVPFVRCFLQHLFGNGQASLSRLCSRDVVEFVQHQATRLRTKRAKHMTTALRSFLQYVRYRGEGTLDLSDAVPVVANWAMTSIPRAISTDQVHQLLASIDQGTAIGRRDHTILLLLARLGLRSSEVAFLELDDIDWNTGTLHVRAKGGAHNKLPLPHEIGEAIAVYLRRGRPLTTSRRVFLCANAPIRGFRGASGISSVVRYALQRAGVNAPSFGAHQFRHGLATEMVRQGASLGEIGDVLGHRHPQTTKIYSKVNVEALRALALPWPGGAQ